ncbi:transcriptional regulator, TetR family [Neorhodopirellula lusitana]|uniref:Transcriptional regulator, TetR family n=1 Tax=Neorhodopirellula lusitana TaxID=445327 RepID=A0ABY1QJ58_9BACT|nr:TetR/AcrR family transcriptional regulator [Neorhodopirellula lusitana]SMP72290.1 transcriptional regulator, TetR family [Neorhodopirellula lusitana]
MNEPPRTIGRPREFDPNKILSEIVDLFWQRGYHGTSFREMEIATGEHRQSLVNAFGDKSAIFQKALQYYIDLRVNEVMELLRGDEEPLVRVKRVFQRWESDARASDRRGCLLINTGGEIGAKDATVADIMAKSTQRLVVEFAKTYQQAMDMNAIADRPTARSLARLTVAAADGVILHARVGGNASAAKQALDALSKLIFDR